MNEYLVSALSSTSKAGFWENSLEPVKTSGCEFSPPGYVRRSARMTRSDGGHPVRGSVCRMGVVAEILNQTVFMVKSFFYIHALKSVKSFKMKNQYYPVIIL